MVGLTISLDYPSGGGEGILLVQMISTYPRYAYSTVEERGGGQHPVVKHYLCPVKKCRATGKDHVIGGMIASPPSPPPRSHGW
jgi:hypothetical protein